MATAFTNPVVVLGMHRSGTSLCAHLLQALGVDMADAAGASPNNRKGHWERPRINDLNDQVFARFSRAWNDPAHILSLPEGWLSEPGVQAIKAALINYLAMQFGNAAPWGFKDPRTARLMPLWRDVFGALRIAPRLIYCVRNPAQVARSITVRDRMAAEQAEYRWLLYNADAVQGIGAQPVCLVAYEDWFARPAETMARVAGFVGLPPLAGEAVAGIIDPELRHDDAGLPPARPLARRLHRALLQGTTPSGQFAPDLLALCADVSTFEQQVQPLLVDREVLRASVADQNRVIGDLNAVIRELRRKAA